MALIRDREEIGWIKGYMALIKDVEDNLYLNFL